MSQPPRYTTLYPSLPPSASNPAILVLDDELAPSSWPPAPAANQGTTVASAGSTEPPRNALPATWNLLSAFLGCHILPQPIPFLLQLRPPTQIIYTYHTVPAMLYQAPLPIAYAHSPTMVQPRHVYVQLSSGYPLPLSAGTIQYWQQNRLPQSVLPGDSVLLLSSA